MFAIIKDGEVIGCTDEPIYIKTKDNIYVNCDRKEAEGIALKGKFIKGAYAREMNGAEFMFEKAQSLEETEASVVEAQESICDMGADFETRIAEIEEAICDFMTTESEV